MQKELTDYIPSMLKSYNIEMPDTELEELGKKIEEDINAKWKGKLTVAALEQNIPVIVVNDDTNLMKNDLSQLPWNPNQFFKANNYLEAAGILVALKSGIDPYSILRPIGPTKIII